MSEKFRCVICNKVDDKEIETNAGDFCEDGFYPDPTNEHYSLCKECKESVEELKLDYENQDDIYGWLRDFANDNGSPDSELGELQSQDALGDEGQTLFHESD